MRIAVISLPRATYRRAAVRAQFAAAGIEFEFLDAVDGAALGPRQAPVDRDLYRLHTRREPLPGEIGCYLSHLAAWRRCVELGEPLLVMEDDLELDAGFAAGLKAVERLPRSIGYIRLESSARRRTFLKRVRGATRRFLEVGDFSLDYVSDVPLCMLAYVVRPHAAAGLIAASRTITAPVDKLIQRTWEHGQPIFALRPAVVRCRPDAAESCIGSRKHKSRSPRLLLARAVYKAKGELRRIAFDKRQMRSLARRAVSPRPVTQL